MKWLTAALVASVLGAVVLAPVTAQAASMPTVTSVSPTTGPIAGDVRVSVHGRDFMSVRSVRFGSSTGASVHVSSSSTLTVVTPPHVAGKVPVTVMTASGTSAAGSYTYVAPASVQSLAPSAGSTGGATVVTVAGTNVGEATSILFGATSGTNLHRLSATEVSVMAPAHVAGVVELRVMTPYGTSAAAIPDRYTYVAPPSPVAGLSVTALSPTSARLSWTRSTSTSVAGVQVRRVSGSAAPATPTSGTLVATVSAATVTWTDTSLVERGSYAYSVFAYTAIGNVYSPRASIAVSTPGAATIVPTAQTVSPTPSSGGCSATTDFATMGWVKQTPSLTLGAYLPGGGRGTTTTARFTVWAVTDAGAIQPIWSPYQVGQPVVPVSGGAVHLTVTLPSEEEDPEVFGFSVQSDDGTQISAASTPCYVGLSSVPPQGLAVSSADFPPAGNGPDHAGDAGVFRFVVSTGTFRGQNALVDHFLYSTTSIADLSASDASVVPATDELQNGYATATITPVSTGLNHLYVEAVDYAGNVSDPVTFDYTVTAANPAAWSVTATPPYPAAGQGSSFLNAVACPSQTVCYALGMSTDQSSNDDFAGGAPLVQTWSNGAWVPTIIDAAGNYGAYVLSCPDTVTCFGLTGEGSSLGIFELAHGTWTADQLTTGLDTGSSLIVTGISCSDDYDCVAVGTYSDSFGTDRGFAAELADGTWTVQVLPTPLDAIAPAPDVAVTSADAVSCYGIGQCTTIGEVHHSDGSSALLVESLDDGSWTSSEPGPTLSDGSATLTCTSATTCLGVDGLTRLINTDGIWTASALPMLPPSAFTLSSAVCTSVSVCRVVVGGGVDQVLTLSDDTWQATDLPVQPDGTNATQAALTCFDDTHCAVVGGYTSSLVATFDGSAWNSTWLPPPNIDDGLVSVSCPADEWCVTAGNSPFGAFVQVRAASQVNWTYLPMPVDATGYGTVTAVSCPAVEWCVAVGRYLVNNAGDDYYEGFADTLTNGSWTSARAIPMTQTATHDAAIIDLSCGSIGSCALLYAASDQEGSDHQYLALLTGGAWVIQTLPSAPDGQADSYAAVSCASAFSCTLVGQHLATAGTDIVIQSLAGGMWTRTEIAGPSVQMPDLQAFDVGSVSCVDATDCTLVGRVLGNDNILRAYAETLRSGTWSFSVVGITGVNESPDDEQVSSIPAAVSCPTLTDCVMITGMAQYGLGVDQQIATWAPGAGWTTQLPPNISGGSNVAPAALACNSPSFCLAVGQFTTESSTLPMVETLG